MLTKWVRIKRKEGKKKEKKTFPPKKEDIKCQK